MTSEVDEFLGELKETEQVDFNSDITDKPVVEEKEEEKVPFHKDPKVQRFIEKEIEKRMSNVQPQTIEKEVVETEDPMLDVLTRVIGNDTPEKLSAIKDFQRALDSRDENIRQAAIRELDAREYEEREAEVEATKELLQGFENIEDTFGVDITSNNPRAQKTRSDFVDFIKQVAPKDEEGQVTEYPDLEQTFKLFQDIQKVRQPNSNRARELASQSMDSSSDVSTVPTNPDKSWNAVEKWFSKLSG